MASLRHVPFEVESTFAKIFKSILEEFHTIVKFGGEFKILNYYDGNYTADPPSVDIRFKLRYHGRTIIFIMQCSTQNTVKRHHSILSIKSNLTIIEEFIHLPFRDLPLRLPLKEGTILKNLVHKIVEVRLREGV